MQNCTSICKSATLNAGNLVIFEGGDTWGTAALSWPLKYGGTSGNPIYYGVDKTWYDTTVSGCASAWNRPIFSPGGVHYSNQTGDPRMVLIGNVSYATLDNIEMTGYLADGSAQPITSDFVDFGSGSNPGLIVENCYFHGWVSPYFSVGTGNISSGATTITNYVPYSYSLSPTSAWGTSGLVSLQNINSSGSVIPEGDNTPLLTGVSGTNPYTLTFSNTAGAASAPCTGCVFQVGADYMNITGGVEGTCSGCEMLNNVIDGSDVTAVQLNPYADCGASESNNQFCVASGIAGWRLPNIWRGNVIQYVSSAFVGECSEWSNNLIQNIRLSTNPTDHTNGIECLDETPSNNVYYNNVQRNTNNPNASTPGGNWSIGLLDEFTPQSGHTSYVFNNVAYNTLQNVPFGIYPSGSGCCGTLTEFNNTVDGGPTWTAQNYDITNTCPGGFTACVLENNHLVSNISSSVLSSCGSNCTHTTNLLQSFSTASGQGYTSSETYAYSPANRSGSTVGAGTNVYSGLCSTIAGFNSAARTACQNATGYACSYTTSNHTVSCPTLTPSSRPSSGAWDIGAYEYAISQATAPTCTPASGNAPQSLTCSNSNSAPTVMCAAISPSNPVSNGAGTGCYVGTPLGTGSSEPYSALIGGTYNFIAGTASLADSNETSYTFGNCPISTQAGVPGIPNYGGLRADTCTMNIRAIPNVWTSYSTDNGFTGAGLCTTNDAGNVICRVSDGNSDPTLIGGTFTTTYSGSDVDQHISLDGSQFVIGRDGSSNSYLYVYSGIGSPQPVTISGSPYTIPTKIVAFSQSTPKKLYAMNIVQGGPSPVTAVNGSGQYTGTIAAGSSNNLAGDYGITSGFGAGGNITSPTLITASTGTSVSFSVTTTAQSCPGTCTLTVVSQAAISSYNLSACTATSCSPTPTAIYDFAQGTCLNWANGFQPSWSSVWRVSNDDSTFSIAFSNNQGAAGGQNTGTLIATYKVGSGCRVMNSFPASIALTAVNGSGVYSCTCPGAAANLYVGATMTVTGFTNSDNNVPNALITASSATSITISATTTTETASASAAFSVAGIPGSTIVGDYGPTGAVAMTNCGGTPGACSTPDAYAIHDMYQFGNANANYTVGEKCLGGTGCTPGTTTLDQPYAWLIDSLNVLATNSSGHFGVGYDYIMHGTNSPQGQTGLFEVQSGGSLVSSPSSINIVSTTSPDNLPNPGAIILDIHCSWNDNLGIDYYPVECGNTTVAIDMAQTPPHFANNGCDQHGYLQSPPNCLTTNPFTGPLVNELIIYPTAPLGGPVCTSAPCSVLPLLRLGNGYISAVSNDFSAANLIESISPNGAYVLYTTDHMCTLGATSVSITGFTGSSGTLTFTAVNAFSAGNSFALGGFSGANAGLNGQTVTVLSAGLSGTQFEATVTGSGYTGGNGKAINAPPYICGGPLWQSTNNYNAGDVMTPLTANTPNCTYHARAAGTSGSTQPTWVSSNLCITTPITDGTVTCIYDGMQNMRGDVFMVKTGIATVVIPPNNFLLLGSTYANRLFDGGY